MGKGLKLILVGVVPLALLLGVGYGLAKVQVIPTQKMGLKNPALGRVLHSVGLYKAPPPVKMGLPGQAAPGQAPAVAALSPEQQALKAQRDALDKERADWEAQKQAQAKVGAAKPKSDAASAPDPREIARLASIYEQMPSENVVKIFAKMPDPQTIALMRRMDEKKVSEILAAIAPERAAFFTQQLSHAPAPARAVASAAP